MIKTSTIPFYNDENLADDSAVNIIVVTRLTTDFGDMLAGATSKGICLLEFMDTDRVEMQLLSLQRFYKATIIVGNSPLFTQLYTQLQAYFKQKLTDFDVPLDTRGTAFQEQAWRALLMIPYGETRSYQQQAAAINNPKAVRAVASANRNNRVSLLVPCHRVIAKDGKMAGYGGGIWRKKYLLDLESGVKNV